METLYNENAINLISEIVKVLLINNEFREAFKIMNDRFAPISINLSRLLLQNEAQYNGLLRNKDLGTLSSENFRVEENRIRLILQNITEYTVHKEIMTQIMIGNLNSSLYTSTTNSNLEKILGPINHLVKIQWLEQGLKKSKSVCKVCRSDGRQGTGFVLNNGYLLTNWHVIPNKEIAKDCKIIFDYEEDIFGNMRKTSEFFLEYEDSKFSELFKYDYAYIKIKNNPENPISQWGYLELDTFSDPQVDHPVTIIQHPLGQTKQIALTSNKIIGKNGCKLFYQTDTERGSSGSPVFNRDWRVIALHHAGRAEDDGGLLINDETKERRGANEGILIKAIAQDLGIDE